MDWLRSVHNKRLVLPLRPAFLGARVRWFHNLIPASPPFVFISVQIVCTGAVHRSVFLPVLDYDDDDDVTLFQIVHSVTCVACTLFVIVAIMWTGNLFCFFFTRAVNRKKKMLALLFCTRADLIASPHSDSHVMVPNASWKKKRKKLAAGLCYYYCVCVHECIAGQPSLLLDLCKIFQIFQQDEQLGQSSFVPFLILLLGNFRLCSVQRLRRMRKQLNRKKKK